MPLASADPFGGVIITDWYSPPQATNERFKINVYILGRDLRADGVRAAIFRQLLDPRTGNWVDASVEPSTQTDVENAILTKDRELRIASLQSRSEVHTSELQLLMRISYAVFCLRTHINI